MNHQKQARLKPFYVILYLIFRPGSGCGRSILEWCQ